MFQSNERSEKFGSKGLKVCRSRISGILNTNPLKCTIAIKEEICVAFHFREQQTPLNRKSVSLFVSTNYSSRESRDNHF